MALLTARLDRLEDLRSLLENMIGPRRELTIPVEFYLSARRRACSRQLFEKDVILQFAVKASWTATQPDLRMTMGITEKELAHREREGSDCHCSPWGVVLTAGSGRLRISKEKECVAGRQAQR